MCGVHSLGRLRSFSIRAAPGKYISGLPVRLFSISEIEGENKYPNLAVYADPDSTEYAQMLEKIREKLNFTTLCYHRLDDMIESVGIDKCKLCTYCWDGRE